MANGHPNARFYPLGMLLDESALVVRRMNTVYATEAVLMQAAISGVISKKANKEFHRQVKLLIDQ